jgi:hypothetical protein
MLRAAAAITLYGVLDLQQVVREQWMGLLGHNRVGRAEGVFERADAMGKVIDLDVQVLG